MLNDNRGAIGAQNELPANTLAEALQAALHAAEVAGGVLRRKFAHQREVKSKGWRDIVTDADVAAQTVILEPLTAQFPDHAILSEEARHDVDLTAPVPTWIIDPLDGTTNYSRQFPVFSVAIGLAYAGELQMGVVYDPLRREAFYAARGQGAFARTGRGRPRRLHVSTADEIGTAVIGLDWARDPAVRDQVVLGMARVAPACRTVRAIGSAALALASVAAGRLDGYFHLALQPWDVAAAAILVLEAGGQLSSPTGTPWKLGEGQLVASNGACHAGFLKTLGF